MTLQDLQALYDIARTAPLQQAMYARQVADLFDRVEKALAAGSAQLALEKAKAALEAQIPPSPPAAA